MGKEYVISHLRKQFGQEFRTLARGRPFVLEGIDGNLIIITTSSGSSRNVPLDGTIDAFNHVMKQGELLLTDIRRYKFSDWNPTYIVSLLASFPDIDYTLRPIRLSRSKLSEK